MERNTHQKKIVSDAVLRLRGQHPSAEETYKKVKETIPTVSRATVYRILNQMAEQGQLLRIPVPSAADRYDINSDPHYHMRCSGCGAVIDISVSVPADFFNGIPVPGEYEITGCDIIFSGLCAECKKQSK